MIEWLLRILILVGVAWLAVGALLYVFQSRLLYLPGVAAGSGNTPDMIGLDYRALELRTEDGETISAWWIPAEEAIATVHFSHGNAGDIGGRLQTIRQFHQAGINLLIYDYRGYGQSSGRPSEAGTYLDARAGWDWLVETAGISPEKIFLAGRSMGAGVAAGLAEQLSHEKIRPAGLILESAFTSVPDMAAELYWWLPVRRLVRIRYDTRSRLEQLDLPTLLIHSPEDEIIPFDHARRLLQAAGPQGELLEIRGDHNTGFFESQETWIRGIVDFIQR
ncbi:MAG: alpha/beta hydrolase, partial [Wenzhouxiangellaceae bacterium]